MAQATGAGSSSGSSKPDTIVMIHGLWMTPRSWEHWKERYESRGYTVLTPAWPGIEVEVEAVNADPVVDRPISTSSRSIESYEKIIVNLDRARSSWATRFGGAITQVLLDRGLGARRRRHLLRDGEGCPGPSVVDAEGRVRRLIPLKSKGKAVPLTPKEFHYAFANTMTEEDSNAIFERYACPGATAVLAEIAFANLHRHPPTKSTSRGGPRPAAVVGFGEDHVDPAEGHEPPRARSTTTRCRSPSTRSSRAVRTSPGAPGWEEVADFAIDWAESHAGLSVSDHESAAGDPDAKG